MDTSQPICHRCGAYMHSVAAGGGYGCRLCGNRGTRDPRSDPGQDTPTTEKRAPVPEKEQSGVAFTAGAAAEARRVEAGAEISRAKFHPSTLRRLARIVCGAHKRRELVAMLEREGLDAVRLVGVSKEKLLGDVLGQLQRDNDHETMLKILEAACDPRDRSSKKDITAEINKSLRKHSLVIGEGGKAEAIVRGTPRPDADGQEFDRRGHHPLVIKHARSKFVKKEYTSAVAEACKALEGTIQKKSGYDGDGVDLMSNVFGKGYLEVSRDLRPRTLQSVQAGLMYLCMGIMSNIRNPVWHTPEAKLAMSRADALDILGTISYLCGQVDGTRRRRTPKPARVERGSRPAGTPSEGRDPDHGSSGNKPTGHGGKVKKAPAILLKVAPDSVERGGSVKVMVVGSGIEELYVGVFSEEGKVKSHPAPLGSCGQPKTSADGRSVYTFPVKTLNYAPGVYRVSVSRTKTGAAAGMRIARFTVTNYAEQRQAAEEKNYREFMGVLRGRRVVR